MFLFYLQTNHRKQPFNFFQTPSQKSTNSTNLGPISSNQKSNYSKLNQFILSKKIHPEPRISTSWTHECGLTELQGSLEETLPWRSACSRESKHESWQEACIAENPERISYITSNRQVVSENSLVIGRCPMAFCCKEAELGIVHLGPSWCIRMQ